MQDEPQTSPWREPGEEPIRIATIDCEATRALLEKYRGNRQIGRQEVMDLTFHTLLCWNCEQARGMTICLAALDDLL